MNSRTNKTLNSPFSDQLEEGFNWLVFDDFVEEEFRQYYAQSTVARARLLPIVGIIAILISMGFMLSDPDVHPVAVIFNVFVMLPILVATFWTSMEPSQHRLYQFLLASSGMLVGMWFASVVTRATLAGNSYYFGAEVAWIFIVWLILGLPFRHAALTALTLSALYIFGVSVWDVPPTETWFSISMLLIVNGIGWFFCYQLEYYARRSFLESKVLAQLAERDGLTGAHNRRSFDQYIERIWRQSRREQEPLTIMLIDIDHFKAYNDHYGHQAGDDALKEVAKVISLSAQRPLDFAARFGGEEFALVLYGPASGYGRELPEQLRQSVRDLKIVHDESDTDHYLTVSIGVAMVHPEAKRSVAGAIQMADEALYEAKEAGRNRVMVRAPDAHIQTGRFRANQRAAN
ncbi:MAG: GGDEF domain-containing protein [Gammaproteobacteria bacterium]|nr:GGDEF domain-containing protein [Gammaproteobacteria bacterium]MBT8443991.1 GGDEF domain-containing protein [Gammaproteobacteria bacterium]NND36421.1 GGDEF domain-containing protein [Gammaproteobacteria bacterium]